MIPQLSVISDEQRQVIEELREFVNQRDMYLAGGTATALHLGHRQSVDLDWFSPAPLEDPMRLAQEIRSSNTPFTVTSVDRGTLHGEARGVRVSFLEYTFPLLQATTVASELQCALAAPIDLAAMKLVAAAQRGSKKDFIDIYALALKQLSIPEMLSAYRKKYSVEDSSRVIYSLTYYDDADQEPTPLMLWPVTWDEVKVKIREWVSAVANG